MKFYVLLFIVCGFLDTVARVEFGSAHAKPTMVRISSASVNFLT